MKYKIFLLIGSSLLLLSAGPAAKLASAKMAHSRIKEEWKKTFGEGENTPGHSVFQTSDGGYIITGGTYSYGAGKGDVWLIKTDSSGNKEWSKTFGGNDYDYGYSVSPASDGGYIITGETYSYGAGEGDAWLIKTDSAGNKEWAKTFGGSDYDCGHSVFQTSDGGYIITGGTYSYGAGKSDAWLIKTDSAGNKEWSKTFGGSENDLGHSVSPTSDGGYIITGETYSYGAGKGDAWLIKTDSAGNKEWSKTFGGSENDYGYSVCHTSDGGYIITGGTYSYGAGKGDAWLIKTDNTGNKEWLETFGGSENDYGHSLSSTSDGGYIITGGTSSYGAGEGDAWLIKTDSAGYKEWSETFGGSDYDLGHSVFQTSDGGYIITGGTFLPDAGKGDVWLIKLAFLSPAIAAAPPRLRPRYPPDLTISGISFTEPSGNKALDAYEKGEIRFTIKNQGKGDALNVEVKTVGLMGAEQLSFKKSITTETISSGTSRNVKIPLTALPDVKNALVKLRIEVLEHFGFDADPVTFSFETRAFLPPELIIADIGIDDDKEGDSYGNNNGIIELGETIEVTIGIQNVGRGDAEDVKAKIEIEGEGNNIYYGLKENLFDLKDIKSGDYKLVKFFFNTSKRYQGKDLPISVEVTEKTGKYRIYRPLGLMVNKPVKRIKEIQIARKEVKEEKVRRRVELSIDVDNIPENSLTRLDDGLCVIFGIEEYRYAPDATFANRDAAIFYEYAKSVFGLPERNIYIRTNQGATKGEFDKVFGENGWIKRRIVKNKSEVIVYFSGHGAPDIKTKRAYLIPYDIDPNYAATAYSLEDIYRNLSRLGAKSVTIFLDACFSGMSREEKPLLAHARPLMIKPGSPETYENITVFTAATGEEISSSYREKKHGLFTYFLLKGLQGYADWNKDKQINVEELFNYLRENVTKEAGFMDREQTPQLLGGEKGRVVIKLK